MEQAFGADAIDQVQADAAAPSLDPLDRIQKRADLHAAGALDADGFRAAKAAVLATLAA